jgi:flagellin
MLGRMRELAVQSSSDTVDNTNRTSLHAEFDSLRNEITRIANAAEYNNQKLLDGTFDKTFQIGANNTTYDVISFTIDGVDDASLGVDTTDISTLAGANTALDDLTSAIDAVSTIRSDLGTIQNRLGFTIASIDNAAENLQSSESTIRDLDISDEITSFTKSQILVQAGMSMLAQANAVPQNVLALFR